MNSNVIISVLQVDCLGGSAEWTKERRALQAEIASLREQLAVLKANASHISSRPPPSEAPKADEKSGKDSKYGKGSVLGKIDLEEDASVVEQLKAALDKNQTKVLDLFREWDADGDGNVSRKEFIKAMPILGLDAPKEAINAVFDEFDPDGSGSVSYHELKKMLRVSAPVPATADKKTSKLKQANTAVSAAEKLKGKR